MRGKDGGNNDHNQGEEELQLKDNSLENLLVHMRQVRATIPVNQKLREELRQRLVQMQIDSQGLAGTDGDRKVQSVGMGSVSGSVGGRKSIWPVEWCSKKNRGWQWGISALLVLVVFSWIWWSLWAPKSLEAGHAREVARLWTEGSFLDLVVGSEQQGLVAVGERGLSILDEYGNQIGLIRPPMDQAYIGAAWSESRDRLALVSRAKNREDQIIQVDMLAKSGQERIDQKQLEAALTAPEVIYTAEKGQRLNDLIWSPDGRTLALIIEDAQGAAVVGLVTPGKEPVQVGSGRNPAWSPDGTRLVVERPRNAPGPSELWLINRDGSGPVRLLEGEKPVWGSRGYLVYIQVTDTERVLTYDLEGAPLFKVQQRIGEIRSISLGSNGEPVSRSLANDDPLDSDHLLLAPDSRPGIYELNWLRQLELEGVQEPRTLLLDQVNRFHKIEFGNNGRTLLIARQEGGAVVLEQIGLREKLMRAR